MKSDIALGQLSLTDTEDAFVISPCSVKFLHILSIEMHRAWAQTILHQVDTIDDKDASRRLIYLCSEMRRLLNNPELFPSDEARVRFLACIALDPELQFHSVCASLLIKSELDEIKTLTERDYTRPTYSGDCNSWENFLLNMAPGAPDDPTDRALTTPKTSFQILPPVGMRIISDLDREEREIVRYMRKARISPSLLPLQLISP